jgi:hypothetical protein
MTVFELYSSNQTLIGWHYEFRLMIFDKNLLSVGEHRSVSLELQFTLFYAISAGRLLIMPWL